MILPLTRTCPKNDIITDLLVILSFQNVAIFCNVNTPVHHLSSESSIMT